MKRYGVCLVSFQILLSTESVGSRRKLVANCVHTADADATKQFRRVGVGGVYRSLVIIRQFGVISAFSCIFDNFQRYALHLLQYHLQSAISSCKR